MLARQKSITLAASLLAFALAVILLRAFDPATSTLFPPCPIRYLTGLYCPGCGSLRAVHQLLHGNLHAAWAMNPLSVALFPFVAYGLVCEAVFYWRGKRLPQLTLRGTWIRGLCAAILLFGVARNLPFHPFDLLAPGALLKF
ncbi:MAG TPA: DUF2752 domain-containing protein [Candidatus Sulfotelmatobacter sp.]|nr:DUF2752 domain-containing protein [Candidatus Sulfotelmatobacter sp.]